jgi:monoamine oxidase
VKPTPAARELARAGVPVRVVEANDRIGGRIYSLRDFCGEPVEAAVLLEGRAWLPAPWNATTTGRGTFSR